MVPSKVHTTMLKTRVLQHITYVFPLMRFIFTDNTVSTLNLVTWAWVGNDGTITPGVTTTTPAPVSTTTTTPAPAQAYVATGFVDPGYVV